LGFLKRLLGGPGPAAPTSDGTVSIPHHFFLVLGDLRIAAEFHETRSLTAALLAFWSVPPASIGVVLIFWRL